jgi:hypothetical protein
VSERDHAPGGFALELGLKDVTLALDTGYQSNVPLPFAGVMKNGFTTAMAKGRENLDWSALALHASESAGVDVSAAVEKSCETMEEGIRPAAVLSRRRAMLGGSRAFSTRSEAAPQAEEVVARHVKILNDLVGMNTVGESQLEAAVGGGWATALRRQEEGGGSKWEDALRQQRRQVGGSRAYTTSASVRSEAIGGEAREREREGGVAIKGGGGSMGYFDRIDAVKESERDGEKARRDRLEAVGAQVKRREFSTGRKELEVAGSEDVDQELVGAHMQVFQEIKVEERMGKEVGGEELWRKHMAIGAQVKREFSTGSRRELEVAGSEDVDQELVGAHMQVFQEIKVEERMGKEVGGEELWRKHVELGKAAA